MFAGTHLGSTSSSLEPRRSGDGFVAQVLCPGKIKNNCSRSMGKMTLCIMCLDSIAIKVPLMCMRFLPLHAAIKSRKYTRLNFICTDPPLSLHIHVQL